MKRKVLTYLLAVTVALTSVPVQVMPVLAADEVYQEAEVTDEAEVEEVAAEEESIGVEDEDIDIPVEEPTEVNVEEETEQEIIIEDVDETAVIEDLSDDSGSAQEYELTLEHGTTVFDRFEIDQKIVWGDSICYLLDDWYLKYSNENSEIYIWMDEVMDSPDDIDEEDRIQYEVTDWNGNKIDEVSELTSGEYHVSLKYKDASLNVKITVSDYPADLINKAELLNLNQEKHISLSNTDICSFVKIEPENDGEYTLYSIGNTDTNAILYTYENGKLHSVAYADDNKLDDNFLMNVELEKRKTYYLCSRQFYHSPCEYSIIYKAKPKYQGLQLEQNKLDVEYDKCFSSDFEGFDVFKMFELLDIKVCYSDGSISDMPVDYRDNYNNYFYVMSIKKYSANGFEQTLDRDDIFSGHTDLQPGKYQVTIEVDNYDDEGCKLLENISRDFYVHKYSAAVEVPATCSANGYSYRTCIDCGKQEIINPCTQPATGAHSFGAPVVTKAPTLYEEGIQESTCAVCGTKKSESLPRLTPTITLNVPNSIPLKVKQSYTVKVSGLTAGDKVKSWTTSNKSVATVSNGKITGKKKGTAVITVTLNSGRTEKITVKVQKGTVTTSEITLPDTPATITLKKGRKLTLKPVVTPVTSKQKVTYKTSNKKNATVSSKGIITAKKAGTATISVKSGKKTIKVKVIVTK